LPSRSRIKNREPAGLFVDVHDEVTVLLPDPRTVRMRGDAEQVDASGGHLHDDQDVKPLEQDRVDVEEVDREQPRLGRAGTPANRCPPFEVPDRAAGW
jgi:hypothetical protein